MSNNRAVELGIFKDVFTDLAITSLESDETNQFLDNDQVFSPVPETLSTADGLIATRLKSSKKKKVKSKTFFGHLSKKPRKKAPRAPMPPSIVMKLIKLGKERVRVPANAVKSTSSKRICQSSFN